MRLALTALVLAACTSLPEAERLRAEQYDAALRHHAQAQAATDPTQALAHEEQAHVLLAQSCPGCAREQIPILLHLARLHAARGDAAGLARCGQRMSSVRGHGLDPRKLSDWPALRRLAELQVLTGDFAGAAQIERDILAGKIEILGTDHPQVRASRARLTELEKRAAGTTP